MGCGKIHDSLNSRNDFESEQVGAVYERSGVMSVESFNQVQDCA